MPSRYLGVILVAIALTFTSFGLGMYFTAAHAPHSVSFPKYEGDRPLPKAAGRLDRPRTPCIDIKGRDESDLCAQWIGARAAESSAIWTERGFWVGLASVIGLGVTIFLTLRATEAAQRSARAAESALEGEGRPHIVDNHITLQGLKNEDDRASLTFKFTNYGQGPAWIKSYAIYFSATPELPKEPSVSSDDVGWSMAPQGWWGVQDGIHLDVPQREKNLILSKTEKLYLFMEIYYVDAQRQCHQNRMVRQYSPERDRLEPVDHRWFLYT